MCSSPSGFRRCADARRPSKSMRAPKGGNRRDPVGIRHILAAARRKRKDAGKAPLPEYPRKRMRTWGWGGVALAVGVGLVAVEPAGAASPTEVLEAFYAPANAAIPSLEPLRELEQPPQAT